MTLAGFPVTVSLITRVTERIWRGW